METILAHLDHWQREGEEIAIATVVRMAGSAPRMPGARMAVTRSGKLVGSVSGGCVETDVLEHARLVLDAGRPALVHYGISDEMGLRVGLSCGGSIDVLIEPFVDDESWQALRHACEAHRPAALAIALVPDDLLGRKLVVPGGGAAHGSIAPDVDESVAAVARDMLGRDGTRILTISREGESAEVFVEALPLPFRLYVVGATDTAVRLCAMAKQVGFYITVIDARQTFATRERFPDADELLLAWPQEVLKDLPLDEHAYVVTLTHDPKFDIPALTHALRSDARYIGAMGSRKTHERRKTRLREQGFTDSQIARVRAPIGLDIGGHTPGEMALSILAEVVAARYGREGGPLQRRPKGIHDDTTP
jgi:xanthine dehydrogenase accessory factor